MRTAGSRAASNVASAQPACDPGAQTGLSPAGRSTPVAASPSAPGPRASARSPRCRVPRRSASPPRPGGRGRSPRRSAARARCRDRAWSRRTAGRSCASSSAVMPGPWSSTWMDTTGGSARPRTAAGTPSAASTRLGPLGHATVPPAGEASRALVRRLMNTCWSWSASPSTAGTPAARPCGAHAACSRSRPSTRSTTRASQRQQRLRPERRARGAECSRADRARSRRCDRPGSGSSPTAAGPGGRAGGRRPSASARPAITLSGVPTSCATSAASMPTATSFWACWTSRSSCSRSPTAPRERAGRAPRCPAMRLNSRASSPISFV